MAKVWRVVLLAVAVVVAAWFALGVRQSVDLSRATNLITGGSGASAGAHLSPSQVRQADAWLNAAGELNPDRTVEFLRGLLALDQHQPQQAQRILVSLTRSEPMNLNAWVQLAAAATLTHDARTTQLAIGRVGVLFRRFK